MAPYPLPLNKAVLIFFPPQHEELLPPESRCELHVVQVVIKQERYQRPELYARQIHISTHKEGYRQRHGYVLPCPARNHGMCQ